MTRRANFFAFVAFVILASVVVVASWFSDRRAQEARHARIAAVTSVMAARVEDFLGDRIGRLRELAVALALEPSLERHHFMDRASRIRAICSGYDALAFIDAEKVVRWRYPEADDGLIAARALEPDPTIGPLLASAARNGVVRATPPLELPRGGKGIAVYVPLPAGAATPGFVEAVFRIDSLESRFVTRAIGGAFAFRLADGETDLLRLGAVPDDEAMVVTEPVHVADRTWTLRAGPASPLDSRATPLLVVGLLLSAVAAWGARQLVLRQILVRENEARLAAMVEERTTELRGSERRFSTLAEAAPNGIFRTDAQGQVVYVNKSILTLTGRGRDEILGAGWTMAIHPGDRELIAAAWRDIVARQEPGRFDSRMLRADGEISWILVHTVPERDGDGHLTGFVGTVTDITDRKRAHAALERTQFAVDHSADAIFWLSRDGMVVDANQAASRFLGYSRAQLVGMALGDIAPDVNPERWATHWAALREQGAIKRDSEYRTSTGRRLPVELVSNHLAFGDQEYDCVFARDISERRAVQESLQRSEARFRTLVETTNIVAWEMDLASFRFTYVSPHAEILLGHGIDEWKRPGFWNDVVHPQDRQWALDYCLGETAAGRDHELEYRMLKVDGSSIWLRNIVGLQRNDAGRVVALSGFLVDIDERKRATEQLERSVSLLQATLESTADGILVTGLDGTVTALNRRVIDMWRMPPDIIQSRIDEKAMAFLLSQLKTPDEVMAKVRDLYLQPETEGTDVVEFADGRVFERLSRPQRLGREVVGRVWSFRDVTERKRAEAALERTQFAVDHSADAIFWIAPDGRIVEANNAAVQSLGYSREHLTTLRVQDIDPNFGDSLWPEHWEDLRAQQTMTLETEHIARDGTHVPVEVVANYLRFEGMEYNCAFVRDITERRRMEERIRVDRARFFSILDALPTYIYLQAPDYSIRYANRSFIDYFSAPKGRPCHEVIRGISEPCTVCRTFDVFQDAQPREWEWTDPKGRVFQIHVHPFIDVDGSRLVLEVGLEITRRKQAEEALSLRTVELERSNSELQEFAYVASHDLQEPLNLISGYLNLLAGEYKGRLDADADEFIDHTIEASQRMKRLIKDLLDYSRVSTKGAAFLPVSLDEALDEALIILRRRISETGATITREQLPTVLADRSQLVRLIQNLLSNAIKYHRPGIPPEIHLDARYEGGMWDIGVRDNGIGIDPRHFSRIFVIFQRLHARDHYDGTGVGLSICRKIVERHGGRLWLDSVPGEGSTFHFTLPSGA